jgi:hypothetical protein
VALIPYQKQDTEQGMLSLPINDNFLFYGDNLFILREHIPTESIDLIYLAPLSIQTTRDALF